MTALIVGKYKNGDTLRWIKGSTDFYDIKQFVEIIKENEPEIIHFTITFEIQVIK